MVDYCKPGHIYGMYINMHKFVTSRVTSSFWGHIAMVDRDYTPNFIIHFTDEGKPFQDNTVFGIYSIQETPYNQECTIN